MHRLLVEQSNPGDLLLPVGISGTSDTSSEACKTHSCTLLPCDMIPKTGKTHKVVFFQVDLEKEVSL